MDKSDVILSDVKESALVITSSWGQEKKNPRMFAKKIKNKKTSATPKSGLLSYVLSALLLWGVLDQSISCRYVLTVQEKKSRIASEI